MTYLRFPTHDGACPSRRSDQIAGFLHRLIEALHHSRRLQAAVVIRQYKHLVDPACRYLAPGESTKGDSADASK
jgi:hypothetical protein